MGLLEDLADILQDAGVGTLSTSLFLGLLPDAPDTAVALYETAGFPPLYIHNGLRPALERPAVQLLVRNQNYATGRAHIQQAYEALCVATDFLAIRPAQMPFALARDEHNRSRFAVNFLITHHGG